MKLSNAIEEAYKRRWSMSNTFTIEITLPVELQKYVGRFDDGLNLNIVNFSSPDFTNDPVEVFAANRWLIQNGRDTLYRFSMTFRDENQMELYKKFWKIYQLTKERYFDDVAMRINVRKDADWEDENDADFMLLDGVLVESISNVDFRNDAESQIAEFSVNFKCTTPKVL